MSLHLRRAAHGDVVQGTLPLEPRETAFHGLSLRVQSLPRNRVLPVAVPDHESLVASVHLDDGLRTVLALDKGEQVLTGVPGISHDISGVEPGHILPCLSQQERSPRHIAGVPWTDARSDGKLGFAVYHEVQLPSEYEFRLAVGVLLDRPSSHLVRGVGLPTVHPALERGRVYRYSLGEPRCRRLIGQRQSPRHILDFVKILSGREPLKESAERRLVRNVIGRIYPAHLRHERVVMEGANHCPRGRTGQHVFRNETAPENLNRVSLGSTAHGAFRGCKKGRIVQAIENRLEFRHNRRGLNCYRASGMIGEDHGKKHLPVGKGPLGVDAPGGSAFYIRTSVLPLDACVK